MAPGKDVQVSERMQAVMEKKGMGVKPTAPKHFEDDTESNAERRLSLNQVKRDSASNLVGGSLYGRDHFKCMMDEQSFSNLVKSSVRFGAAPDGEQKQVRRRKVTLKSVTRKMMFAMRLRVKKKHLSINDEMNKIYEITHINNFTDEEIRDVWYGEKEMQDIKWENAEVAASMDNGLSVEEADGRGLEGRTEEGGWNKYKMRKDAVNEVLDEFDRQFDSGLVEWEVEKLREAYEEISEKAHKQAHARGDFDEKTAISVTKDDVKKEVDKWASRDLAKLKKKPAQ